MCNVCAFVGSQDCHKLVQELQLVQECAPRTTRLRVRDTQHAPRGSDCATRMRCPYGPLYVCARYSHSRSRSLLAFMLAVRVRCSRSLFVFAVRARYSHSLFVLAFTGAVPATVRCLRLDLNLLCQNVCNRWLDHRAILYNAVSKENRAFHH